MKQKLRVIRSLEAVCVAVAVLLFVLPVPTSLVERAYSNGVYPGLQSSLTYVSNLIPFSLSDLLLTGSFLGLVIWWSLNLRAAQRGAKRRAAAMLLVHTVAIAALVYLAFLFLWGFNYQRRPLSSVLQFNEDRVTRDALRRLSRVVIERLNAGADLRSTTWPAEAEWRENLGESLGRVLKEVGASGRLRPALPKKTVFNFYLKAAGVSGLTSPFSHEVILDSTLLPFERPFVLAHEWAHLSGFADESEASFIGLLACIQSEVPALRYSGWLELHQLVSSVRTGPDAVAAGLRPEVIADLQAIEERINQNTSRMISQAQSEVYDRFLKANRVAEGIASYGLVVRLLLGTSLDDDWIPETRHK